jgi:hypothetical protein
VASHCRPQETALAPSATLLDHPPLPAAITTLDFVRSMKILRFGFQPDGLATRRFLPKVVTFQLIIQGLRWN